ncbi:MAG: hypothetical protein QNK23_00955 [Crocinitomicaceae bacterium]|nr:hypothetical protein [Crocinitomicaceae bacterium]
MKHITLILILTLTAFSKSTIAQNDNGNDIESISVSPGGYFLMEKGGYFILKSTKSFLNTNRFFGTINNRQKTASTPYIPIGTYSSIPTEGGGDLVAHYTFVYSYSPGNETMTIYVNKSHITVKGCGRRCNVYYNGYCECDPYEEDPCEKESKWDLCNTIPIVIDEFQILLIFNMIIIEDWLKEDGVKLDYIYDID